MFTNKSLQKKKKKTHINTETNSISNMGYYLKTLPL